jgi:hypothetical protein
MTRNIYQSVLTFTVLLLYSCEYHSAQDHFVEKKAPSENLDVSINLLEIPEGETIYIYTGTSLRYTLDISDKKLVTVNFELDGVKCPPSITPMFLYNLSAMMIVRSIN